MREKKKIICTIGPASYNPRILRALKSRGVDFFRINLSHTSEEEIEEKVLELQKFHVPVIIDTEGPQIRTGNTYEIFLKEGEEIKIYNRKVACDKNKIFLTPIDIIKRFSIGDLISVDFNSTLLKVSNVSNFETEGFITCKVLISGIVGGRKAIYIDDFLDLPTFSNKDFQAIEIAKKYGVKIFTLSFIRNREEVLTFRKIYPEAILYSKIEVREAIRNLKEILEVSDGILIDRGDLSKEVPIEKIPLMQKYILNEARKQGKEAFVATNTLEKMSISLKPDKSEANDIINTLLDGATGIALTKETATGNYPVETVNMLTTLIKQIDYLDIDQNSTKEQIFLKMHERKYFDEFKSPTLLISPHGGKLINRFLIKSPSEEEFNSMKKLIVDEKIIMDAEQIAIGAFSPLEGFMLEKDFNSVLDNLHLSNGIVWPLPIVLQVFEEQARQFNSGDKILLVYEKDNKPYAILNLVEIYKPNKAEIVKKWFGTDSREHPGVEMVINSGDYFLGGEIDLIKKRDSLHKIYELTPQQTRKIFSERGWSKVVGFHTRNAIHKSHEFIQIEAMERELCDGLFVHPVIGKKKKGDFKTNIIIESYEKMVNDFYPKGKVVLSAFSTFSRYAGPREALFTALVRKNFGCSHFIIGRDHTGVGDFYPPKASHEIFDKFSEEEIGVKPIKFGEVFYSDIEKKHIHELDNPTHPEDRKLNISGTQAREILQKGIKPPEWFMRPEISELIINKIKRGEEVFVEQDNDDNNLKSKAKILWFTGLSGSGKTTIAELLKIEFEKREKKVKVFDGDVIRNTLHTKLGFSPEDIKENNQLILELCKKEIGNYDFILVPIISPFRESRTLARQSFGNDFIEIFFNCPLEECKRRDVKGLYLKAEKGEIQNFIGIHVPYEPPENPEITLNTYSESVLDSIKKIIDFLNKK